MKHHGTEGATTRQASPSGVESEIRFFPLLHCRSVSLARVIIAHMHIQHAIAASLQESQDTVETRVSSRLEI